MLLLSVINRQLSFSNMAKIHLYVFSLIVLIYASKNEELYSGNKVVLEDEPFTITCRLTSFDTLKWQKDGVNIVPSEANNFTFTETVVPGGLEATLSVSRAHVRHSGRYRCSAFHAQSHLVFVISANAVHGNQDVDNFKVLQLYKNLSLLCNVSDSMNPLPRVTWLKRGEEVKESDRVKLTQVTEDKKTSELSIQKALESDADNYTCVVNYVPANGSDQIKEEFVVVVKPSVWMPKTVTIIEGEELELNCSATGVPTPKITWIIGGNVTLTESSERILLSPDHKGVPNAILTIKETMLSDRANYVCLATNLASDLVNTNATTETFVRVKDKLAALWPFLGICAEVFVLCTIILIYEKRRNKAELEESDTDQSPEQKNTPDMGKDTDVRHRK